MKKKEYLLAWRIPNLFCIKKWDEWGGTIKNETQIHFFWFFLRRVNKGDCFNGFFGGGLTAFCASKPPIQIPGKRNLG